MVGADGMALTLAYTGTERMTLFSSGEVASRLEDIQDVLAQGPGRTAYATGELVHAVIGNAVDRRWPHFGAAAWDAVGDLELHSFPVRPHGEVVGVMSCHHGPDTDACSIRPSRSTISPSAAKSVTVTVVVAEP